VIIGKLISGETLAEVTDWPPLVYQVGELPVQAIHEVHYGAGPALSQIAVHSFRLHI
jgi:hypothetical protein